MSSQYGELLPTSAAEICWRVWGTPANFNGFHVLAVLLHGTLVGGVSQTLRHWTEGATYIRQCSYHVGHWPTFLVLTVHYLASFCGLCFSLHRNSLPLEIFGVRFCMKEQCWRRRGFACCDIFNHLFHADKLKSTNLYILNVVRCPCVCTYVCNAGRGQLSSKWRHNENDVTVIIAGLVADCTRRRYGDWWHVVTGCNALVHGENCSLVRYFKII